MAETFTATTFDAKAHLESTAPMLGLDIADAWKPVVADHLANAAQMAEIIDQVDLGQNTIDLANTFSPD